MDFLKEFKNRGYFYQCTNDEALNKLQSEKKIAAYIGFDCTAKSLHIGNLMQVMILRLLQKAGHKPIILIGGATTKIGDPTGKDEMRKVITDDQIAENIAGIRKSLSKFIKFEEGETSKFSDAIMVNNSDWLESIGYIEFLRDYGRHFSVNRMLTMESVKARLERQQSLTFLEFNYMLLQAFDFYKLNRTHSCVLQLGGSDQWGNIVTGTELTRKITGEEVFGLTTPLLTTSSGVKMGKSVSGAVWLNEDMLSSYDYFQYWRNTEDADVTRFAKLYCEYSDEEFIEFSKLAADNINEAKKQLAYRATQMCHGQEKAEQALQTAIEVFEKGGLKGLQTWEITQDELVENQFLYQLLSASKLTSSNGEARRAVRGRGVKINDEVIDDENFIVSKDVFRDSQLKLSFGKKKHLLVKLV